MEIALTELLPRWTKRVVTTGGGRDPLGLSRVGFMLTDHLMKGIITTTDRARYYSFYCWSLWHAEQQEEPNNHSDFVEAFRRREAAMAMASYAANTEISPVGVDVVRSHLDRGKQSGGYDCNYKVLPSNELGGYGQYYGGSMYALGLTTRDENWIDHVTSSGDRIAKLFHDSIKDSSYVKDRYFLEDSIPEKVLRELQSCITLDSISTEQADAEREELINLFWNRDGDLTDEVSVLRRQSLTLILDTTKQFGEHKVYPKCHYQRTLDEYLLFAFYYGVLWHSDDKVADLNLLKGHEFCVELWRQFCLHQFITQALETLLFAVIEEVGSTSTGLGMDDLIERLVNGEFPAALENIAGAKCATPRELLHVFGISGLPSEDFSRRAQRRYLPGDPLSEQAILDNEASSPGNSLAVSVALLGVLYAKWRGLLNDRAPKYVAQKSGDQIWAGSVLPYLDRWSDASASWDESLRLLVEDLVLNQHDRIMYEKRRLDSSWIQRVDGFIKKDQDYRPVWRASRFLNAAKIMADLKLLRIGESGEMKVTTDGRKLLKELLQITNGE